MSYILPRLSRTLQGFFRIGAIRLKDNAGIVEAKDAGDTAYTGIQAASFRAANNGFAVTVQAPTLSADRTFTLPATLGANGQALVANGSGGHTYQNIDGASNTVKAELHAFTEATSSPSAISTLPAGIRVMQVTANVTAAAAGGAPTIQVVYGAGNTAVTLTSDVDLTETGTYVIPLTIDVVGSEAFKLLITPDSQTFTGDVLIHYSLPA